MRTVLELTAAAVMSGVVLTWTVLGARVDAAQHGGRRRWRREVRVVIVIATVSWLAVSGALLAVKLAH